MNVRLRNDQKIKVLKPYLFYPIMREVLLREKGIDKRRERGWVASLASDGMLLNLELISIGNSHSVNIEPSAVFGIALQKESRYVILVHYHPDGTLEPSKDDDEFTENMIATGEIVKVHVLDHMIITDSGYYSYSEKGDIEKVRKIMEAATKNPSRQLDAIKVLAYHQQGTIEKLRKKIERLEKQALKPVKKAAPKKKPTKKAK